MTSKVGIARSSILPCDFSESDSWPQARVSKGFDVVSGARAHFNKSFPSLSREVCVAQQLRELYFTSPKLLLLRQWEHIGVRRKESVTGRGQGVSSVRPPKQARVKEIPRDPEEDVQGVV